MTMRRCVDCGDVALVSPCHACRATRERLRNRLARRRAYRDPTYLSQPSTGICWLCGKPGADTRDHVVPLSIDPTSVITRPAHRSCNSGRRA